jgi:hypothetical protein
MLRFSTVPSLPTSVPTQVAIDCWRICAIQSQYIQSDGDVPQRLDDLIRWYVEDAIAASRRRFRVSKRSFETLDPYFSWPQGVAVASVSAAVR